MTAGNGKSGRAELPAALFAGAASAALYLSFLFSTFFLVPIQANYVRHGRPTGRLAAGVAFLTVAAGQVITFTRTYHVAFLTALIGCLPVLALAGGIVLLNAAFWSRLRSLWRLLLTGAALAVAATPFVAGIATDQGFKAELERLFSLVLAPILQGQGAAAAEGYDQAMIAATLVPAEIVALWIRLLSSTYVALILLLVAGNWWLGGRYVAARGGAQGASLPPALRDFKAPAVLLWPVLGAWAVLGGALLLKAPPPLEAAAWNLALSLALVYAAQGLGIAAHFLDRLGLPGIFRLALGATLVTVVTMEPAVGLAVVALPLLGISEVWIPYRTFKGVGQ